MMKKVPTTALLLALSLVRSAAAEPLPLATALEGDARSAYESATLLFQDHDFAGAATKYRVALESSHDPRLYWNIAACEKELRHYVKASVLVERFLKEASSVVSPDRVEQARATAVALKQFFSPVRFKVEPEGSKVVLDNEELGRSPLVDAVAVDLGAHVVRVEHEGFVPYEGAVTVAGVTEVEVTVALKPTAPIPSPASRDSTLKVAPSDADAIVSVDGKVVGGGVWEGGLPPGVHHIEVSGKGRVTYASDLSLTPGERRSLEVALKQESHGAALWPWLVAGGAVVVAGGIVGAYFALNPKTNVIPVPNNGAGYVQLKGFGL